MDLYDNIHLFVREWQLAHHLYADILYTGTCFLDMYGIEPPTEAPTKNPTPNPTSECQLICPPTFNPTTFPTGLSFITYVSALFDHFDWQFTLIHTTMSVPDRINNLILCNALQTPTTSPTDSPSTVSFMLYSGEWNDPLIFYITHSHIYAHMITYSKYQWQST